jgi:aminodeoxyfutalosine synthase
MILTRMPVSDVELASLAATHDIINLGMLADDERRRRHGTRTTFVRVAEVEPAVGAPVRVPLRAGEVRITGTPPDAAAAVGRVREVAAAAGTIPLSAYSLADLEEIAGRDGITLRSLLEELRAAGLELVSEAPFDRCQSARRSIEEANIAGLVVGRLTIHCLPDPDVLGLLKSVARLQRDVAVLRAFAPLPRKMNAAVPTTGYDDVKRIALARMVVDNVPSIQVDWALYGPKLAQVGLTVGADDVDAVSAEDECGEGRRRTPLEEIRRNIQAAGLDPVERNGRFDPLPPA